MNTLYYLLNHYWAWIGLGVSLSIFVTLLIYWCTLISIDEDEHEFEPEDHESDWMDEVEKWMDEEEK